MITGNHETPAINRVYGFFEECNRRYHSTRLWNAFQVIPLILSQKKIKLLIVYSKTSVM